jgi:hypothetical protein
MKKDRKYELNIGPNEYITYGPFEIFYSWLEPSAPVNQRKVFYYAFKEGREVVGENGVSLVAKSLEDMLDLLDNVTFVDYGNN